MATTGHETETVNVAGLKGALQQYKTDITDKTSKSLVGYYTCGTAAATAAKTITASYYTLLQGGSIKVKFTYKNTADDATLKIGSADAKPLFYAGRRAGSSNSWEANEVVEIFYDGTNYYANNVMGGGAGDGAFDISVYNAVGGTPAQYASLSAALGTNGANVPASKRKGGMSVKFVQSSDNIYMQYRLMADEFTTDISAWQGVENEPTAGSSNLVKSGGIASAVMNGGITLHYDSSKKHHYINGNWKAGDVLCIEVKGMSQGNWNVNVMDEPTQWNVIYGTDDGIYFYTFTKQVATQIRISLTDPTGAETITVGYGALPKTILKNKTDIAAIPGYDNTPIPASTNLVRSGGVAAAIMNCGITFNFDSDNKFKLINGNWKAGDVLCVEVRGITQGSWNVNVMDEPTQWNVISGNSDGIYFYTFTKQTATQIRIGFTDPTGAETMSVVYGAVAKTLLENKHNFDDFPIAGSTNLVKSGNIFKSIFPNLYDLLNNIKLEKHYLKTDNTLNESVQSLWDTYYKIPVKKGDVVYYNKLSNQKLANIASYYIITDSNDNVLVQRDGTSSAADMFGEFSYKMPSDGFVSLCVYLNNGVVVDEVLIATSCTNIINKVEKQIETQIETISTIVSPFRSVYKFGVVGDSLSVGFMTDPTTGQGVQRNIKFSWGQILARKNGQVCLNFGFAGATTSTWFTDTTYNCPTLLADADNMCQVYIVGLGANHNSQLGSMSDIDWSNGDNNADTFYGQYARILQLIRSSNPKALIFCLTLPYPREYDNYNTAIKAICADSHLANYAFVVDLVLYNEVLQKYIVGDVIEQGANYDKYYRNWHFTAPGYAMVATLIEEAVSRVMNSNTDKGTIQSIGQIPYGSNDVIN